MFESIFLIVSIVTNRLKAVKRHREACMTVKKSVSLQSFIPYLYMYTNKDIWKVSYPILLALLAQNVINVTDTEIGRASCRERV